MPLSNEEARIIARLVSYSKHAENLQKIAIIDRDLTDDERSQPKVNIEWLETLQKIQKRVKSGEQLSQQQKDDLSTASAFINSVIKEREAQEKKRGAQNKEAETGPETATSVPKAQNKPDTLSDSSPRSNHRRMISSRQEVLNKYRKELDERGINNTAILKILSDAQVNIASMNDILFSQPRFFSERSLNSLMNQFDKNIEKLITQLIETVGLERFAKIEIALSEKKTDEMKKPEEKKLTQEGSKKPLEFPSHGAKAVEKDVVPVPVLSSYKEATGKAVSRAQQNWRIDAQKIVDIREKKLDEFIEKINKKGITDPATMNILEKVKENFRSMKRIIISPPAIFEQRSFNSALRDFDRNSSKLNNLAGLNIGSADEETASPKKPRRD